MPPPWPGGSRQSRTRLTRHSLATPPQACCESRRRQSRPPRTRYKGRRRVSGPQRTADRGVTHLSSGHQATEDGVHRLGTGLLVQGADADNHLVAVAHPAALLRCGSELGVSHSEWRLCSSSPVVQGAGGRERRTECTPIECVFDRGGGMINRACDSCRARGQGAPQGMLGWAHRATRTHCAMVRWASTQAHA